MSIRTTVTLEEDVLERVKDESVARGISFRDTLNDLLRLALVHSQQKSERRALAIEPTHLGYRAGLNYDSIESLLEYAEGEEHR